jgi:hypothetical protein
MDHYALLESVLLAPQVVGMESIQPPLWDSPVALPLRDLQKALQWVTFLEELGRQQGLAKGFLRPPVARRHQRDSLL